MSHVTPEELDKSLRRVKQYVDSNTGGGGSGQGGSIIVDDALSDTSENPVQNKVVKAAIDSKADASDIPDVSGFATSSDLDAKQDALTFDSEPTENSTNPVTSGGVYQAIQDNILVLPIASPSILGGIKVGAGLEIDENGVLKVAGFQSLPGYVSLSESSVVLNYTTTTKTISVLGSSGQITSVASANENYATVTFDGGVITITAAESGGETTIDIAVAANPPNYNANVIHIPVVVDKTKIVTWADGTDEEIAAMLEAHRLGRINIYDHWKVGDYRTVSLSAMDAVGVGESHVAQDVDIMLVDRNVVDLASGGKCTFVWQQKDLLQNFGYMNPTATNAGGWRECARRTWCNDVYFNALPTGFRSLIKEASIKTGAGESSSELYTTSDKIFLPCSYNLYGSDNYVAPGEDDVSWSYYGGNVGTSPLRVKKRNGLANAWHLRSPFNNSASFRLIGTNGGGSYTYASSNLGIAPCGCI